MSDTWVVVVAVALPLAAMVHALVRPSRTYRFGGPLAWAVIILLLNVFGVILYLSVGLMRPSNPAKQDVLDPAQSRPGSG